MTKTITEQPMRECHDHYGDIDVRCDYKDGKIFSMWILKDDELLCRVDYEDGKIVCVFEWPDPPSKFGRIETEYDKNGKKTSMRFYDLDGACGTETRWTFDLDRTSGRVLPVIEQIPWPFGFCWRDDSVVFE